MEEILNNIKKIKNFSEYKEFSLGKSYIFNDYKDIIIKLKQSNTEISYNKITRIFDNIGVIDVNGKRYYDFDDSLWTLTNKGINGSIIL